MSFALTKRVVGGVVGLAIGTLLALAAPLTYAQTYTASTTPGAPSTGAAPAGTNAGMLGASALALVAGGVYLARTRKEA